jgi:hypothetical protein
MQSPPKEKPQNDECMPDDDLERGYYYDDAHGYETYDPDKQDVEPDEEGTAQRPPECDR